MTGQLWRGQGPHTHHPQAESLLHLLLLLRLLLLPPPLPGVTAAAPPLTSLARTVEESSSGMGRGSAPRYPKCASAPRRPPIAQAVSRVAGGRGWLVSDPAGGANPPTWLAGACGL